VTTQYYSQPSVVRKECLPLQPVISGSSGMLLESARRCCSDANGTWALDLPQVSATTNILLTGFKAFRRRKATPSMDGSQRSSYEVPLVGDCSGIGGVQRVAPDDGANTAAWSKSESNAKSRTQTQTPPVSDQDKGQPKAADVQNAPAQPPATLPTQDDDQIKHDGGIHDVDAAGNRNVGCGRGVGNWYSIEKQVALGRAYSQQIESQIKLVNDPVVTEYVNRIGQNLVRVSDAQVPNQI